MLSTGNYLYSLLIILIFSLTITLANENSLAREQTPKSDAPGDQVSSNETPSRHIHSGRLLKLSRIFNFKVFKKLYNRNYKSILDELVRSKLFQGRAIRAFISAVKYKHGISSSYLAINHMSDWTESEIDKMYLDGSMLLFNGDSISWKSPISSGKKMTKTIASKRQHFERLVSKSRPMLDKHRKIRSKREVSERKMLLKDLIRVPQVDDFIIETVFDNKKTGESPEVADHEMELLNEQIEIDVPKSGVSLRSLSKRIFSRKESKSDGSGSGEDEIVAELTIAKPDSVQVAKVKFDIDHRKCLTPVREQLHCSSCYLFATIALYEWAYCRATGKRLAFSEQYVLDYGHLVEGLDGCSGGIFTEVGQFVKRYGLELAETYPYVGGVTIGPYTTAMIEAQAMGYIRLEDPTFWAIPRSQLETYLKKYPLLINVTIGSLTEFGGGIDEGTNCSSKSYHTMLLVGSGQEDGQQFWLFKNSFSHLWGEKGFYRLNKESNCIHPAWGYALRGNFNKNHKNNINKNNDPGFVKRKFIRDLKKIERAKQIEENTLNKLPYFT